MREIQIGHPVLEKRTITRPTVIGSNFGVHHALRSYSPARIRAVREGPAVLVEHEKRRIQDSCEGTPEGCVLEEECVMIL